MLLCKQIHQLLNKQVISKVNKRKVWNIIKEDEQHLLPLQIFTKLKQLKHTRTSLNKADAKLECLKTQIASMTSKNS